ncbi:DnaD domain protein [Streptococcus dentiloxodontae]
MKPIDDFIYLANQAVSVDDMSLMRCYYPIIGSDAYILYHYLVSFYDNGRNRHKFADILNHTGFGMEPLETSLAVLTALDLIAFYQSPSGFYVVEIKAPLSSQQFLNHAVYCSLLEQKIGEVELSELKPAVFDNLRDLSKNFSEVFGTIDKSLKSDKLQVKNNFDLTSFRNRMLADGLQFSNEKEDVPALYSLSEMYGLTWYDIYLLAKETASQNRILTERVAVKLTQSKQAQAPDASLTEEEKALLQQVRSDKALPFLEKYKSIYKAEVTKSERDIINGLAQRHFLDELINLMVLYTLNQTHSVNINKTYITKLANDFAYKNITSAEAGLLALRPGQPKNAKSSKKSKRSNVPQWSDPNYKNETTAEEQAKLDAIKERGLKRLEESRKE